VASSARDARLQELVSATREYVRREVELAEAQAKALQDVLDNGYGGSGLSGENARVAAVAAQNDLWAYLGGA
jgi:hypothetical protein